jgi:hypothetical protein
MWQHRSRTGLPHDAVMVFRKMFFLQGDGSLKRSGFLVL